MKMIADRASINLIAQRASGTQVHYEIQAQVDIAYTHGGLNE